MALLILRLLPYLAAVVFFALSKGVFYWPDYWLFLAPLMPVVPSGYFILLKARNKVKSISALYLYSLLFVFTGFTFSLILENSYVINLFLLGWSFLFWLYLEAVFHDFYETHRIQIVDLKNFSPYLNILIVFFLTASLVNFSIFLNWPIPLVIAILTLTYFFLYYWFYLKYADHQSTALIYAFLQALILVELLVVLLLWPVSFYVLAVLLSTAYYLMLSLTLARWQSGGQKRFALKIIILAAVVVILTLLTAVWL